MVVPERPSIEDLRKRKRKPSSPFLILRCLLSLVLFVVCGIGIFNTIHKDSLFGIDLLVMNWWQISIGLFVAIGLLVPGKDDMDDDLFGRGGGPPIIR